MGYSSSEVKWVGDILAQVFDLFKNTHTPRVDSVFLSFFKEQQKKGSFGRSLFLFFGRGWILISDGFWGGCEASFVCSMCACMMYVCMLEVYRA